MDIIALSRSNIASEHICCAFSDKKCLPGYEAKKNWLRERFDEGYQFRKLNVRGKVFIQYGKAELAWAPVEAPGYLMIDCFWVSGQYKGQGYGKALLHECIADAQNTNGLVVVASTRKMPFMSDRKFLATQGFELCDTAAPYFELWYKPMNAFATKPKFSDCARNGRCDVDTGLAVYYTDACPFTDYYINTELASMAGERGIPLIIKKIQTIDEARHHFVPFTLHSLFYNGQFVTQQILSKSTFDKFIKV